jgi:hypothetical protein
MPYTITTGLSACNGYAVVKDDDGEIMGCHRSELQAERQMAALYASEDDSEDIDENDDDLSDDEERAVSYKPTQGMIDEAKQGLEWRQEFNRGGTEVGVARARDISNGRPLSLETVNRSASFFARHEVDKQGQGFTSDEDGYPSAGRIAWALWGGDPGRTFVENIQRMNKETPNRELAQEILASVSRSD